MKTIYCFSVLGFLLSSCMSTYVMSDEKITYGDLNEQLADRMNAVSGDFQIVTEWNGRIKDGLGWYQGLARL